MDLTKEDVAELLHISERAVKKLAKEGTLPSYEWGGEYRFSREELENWIYTSSYEHLDFDGEAQKSTHNHWRQFSLYRAINKGVILHDIEAIEKKDVMREVLQKTSSELPLDTEVVYDMLLEREKLNSTALGKGIAIPHPREILLPGFLDIMIIAFPSQPIDWGALDGDPIHTLFFLFACDDKRHLNLLAKLAYLSSSSEFLAFCKSHPNKYEILEFIKTWEISIKNLINS